MSKKGVTRQDSLLGSLLGFAIGDAMGATTEFMSKEEISHRYGEVTHIIGGGWLHLRPGEVTDDTQMMLCVAEACKKDQEGFTRECCRNFLEWYEGHPKDVGGACRAVIEAGRGKSPEVWMLASMDRQMANNRQDLGNGSVMRALFPLLIGRPAWAIQQGRLTHNNLICDEYINDYGYAVFRALNFPQMWNGPDDWGFYDPTGRVENSVKNAVYWSSKTHSLKEAVLGAVNHGGDADTIAALTGGIAGAFYGVQGIPQQWINELDPKVKNQIMDLVMWAMNNEKDPQ